MNPTLPTDSNERKEIPITSGVLRYFPAALAGVARVSKAGNDKHNPGEPLHHARGKSMDHADCIVRHLLDVQDLLAEHERAGDVDAVNARNAASILAEASQLCWRALALSQELHERFGAPLAPGARLPESFCLASMQASMAHREADLATRAVAHTAAADVQVTCTKPGFPVTPGLYKTRDGRTVLVARIKTNVDCYYPARDSNNAQCWTLSGHYWANEDLSPADLIERVPEKLGAPHRSDPVDYP